ncbi:MAG: hypothetical protein ACK56I_03175, partial [bacterium]
SRIENDAVRPRSAWQRHRLSERQVGVDDADAGGLAVHDPRIAIGGDGDAARGQTRGDDAAAGTRDGIKDGDAILIGVYHPQAGIGSAAHLIGHGARHTRLGDGEHGVNALAEAGGEFATGGIASRDGDDVASRHGVG